MRRCYFGFILLAVLLLGGLLSGGWMVRRHEPMEARLEQAAEYALKEDWIKARSILREVRTAWEDSWHTSACFADHSPMEEMDGIFSQLQIYGQEEEKAAFAALCMELSRNMGAMGEAHRLTWWNLL